MILEVTIFVIRSPQNSIGNYSRPCVTLVLCSFATCLNQARLQLDIGSPWDDFAV